MALDPLSKVTVTNMLRERNIQQRRSQNSTDVHRTCKTETPASGKLYKGRDVYKTKRKKRLPVDSAHRAAAAMRNPTRPSLVLHGLNVSDPCFQGRPDSRRAADDSSTVTLNKSTHAGSDNEFYYDNALRSPHSNDSYLIANAAGRMDLLRNDSNTSLDKNKMVDQPHDYGMTSSAGGSILVARSDCSDSSYCRFDLNAMKQSTPSDCDDRFRKIEICADVPEKRDTLDGSRHAQGDLKVNRKIAKRGCRQSLLQSYSTKPFYSGSSKKMNKHSTREEMNKSQSIKTAYTDECSGFRIIASHPKVRETCLSPVSESNGTSRKDIEAGANVGGTMIDLASKTRADNTYGVTKVHSKSSSQSNKNYNSFETEINEFETCVTAYKESSSSASSYINDTSSIADTVRQFKCRILQKNEREADVSVINNCAKKETRTKKESGKNRDLYVTPGSNRLTANSGKICKKGNIGSDEDIQQIQNSMEHLRNENIYDHNKKNRHHLTNNSVRNESKAIVKSSKAVSSKERISCTATGKQMGNESQTVKRDSLQSSSNTHRKSRTRNTANYYRRKFINCKSTCSSIQHDSVQVHSFSEKRFEVKSGYSSDSINVFSSLERHRDDSDMRSSVKSSLTIKRTRISRNMNKKNYVSNNLLRSTNKYARAQKLSFSGVDNEEDDSVETLQAVPEGALSSDSVFSKESEVLSDYTTCSEYSADSLANKRINCYSRHSKGRKRYTGVPKERVVKSRPEQTSSKVVSESKNVNNLLLDKRVSWVDKGSEENRNEEARSTNNSRNLEDAVDLKMSKHGKSAVQKEKHTVEMHSHASSTIANISQVQGNSCSALQGGCKISVDDGNCNHKKPTEDQLASLLITGYSFKENQMCANTPGDIISRFQDEPCSHNIETTTEVARQTIPNKTLLESYRSLTSSAKGNSEGKEEQVSRIIKKEHPDLREDSHVAVSVASKELDDTLVSPLLNNIRIQTCSKKKLASNSSRPVATFKTDNRSNGVHESLSPIQIRNASTKNQLGMQENITSFEKPKKFRTSKEVSNHSFKRYSKSTIDLASVTKVRDFTCKKNYKNHLKQSFSSSSESSSDTVVISKLKYSRRRGTIATKHGPRSLSRNQLSGTINKCRSQSRKRVTYASCLVEKGNRESPRNNKKIYAVVRDPSPYQRHTKRSKSRARRCSRPRGNSQRASLHQGNASKNRKYSGHRPRRPSLSPGKRSREYRGNPKYVTNRHDQQIPSWSFKDVVQSWAKKVIESSTWLNETLHGQDACNKEASTKARKNAYVYRCHSESSDINRGGRYCRGRSMSSFDSGEGARSGQCGGDHKVRESPRRVQHRVDRGTRKVVAACDSEQSGNDGGDGGRLSFLPIEMRDPLTKKRGYKELRSRDRRQWERKESRLEHDSLPGDVTSKEKELAQLSAGVDVNSSHVGGGIKEMKWAMTQINIFNDGSKTYAIGQQSKKSPPKDAVKNVTRVFVTVPIENGLSKETTFPTSADG